MYIRTFIGSALQVVDYEADVVLLYDRLFSKIRKVG